MVNILVVRELSLELGVAGFHTLFLVLLLFLYELGLVNPILEATFDDIELAFLDVSYGFVKEALLPLFKIYIVFPLLEASALINVVEASKCISQNSLSLGDYQVISRLNILLLIGLLCV